MLHWSPGVHGRIVLVVIGEGG